MKLSSIRKALLTTSLLVAIGMLLFPLSSYGRQAHIRELLITADARSIKLYAVLTDCFTHHMEKAIMAGVPTKFTFYIELWEEKPHWFDRRIVRLKVHHTLKYDNVKNVFYVYADEREAAGFPDMESAKRAMAELSGVPIIPRSVLSTRKPYYLRVKAMLEKVRLPMHMEVLFFFVSLWNFETDWVEKPLPAAIP